MNRIKVTYRELIPIAPYKAIEHKYTVTLDNYWWNGNILYYRPDRFNVKAIGKSDIISIEEA